MKRIMDSNKLNEAISAEISSILKHTEAIPEEIKIEIHYKHSLARLTIDEDKIRSLAEKGAAG